MNKILLSVIIGAAVAGVVYYIYNREGAEKLMGDVKDAASDAFGHITDHLPKMAEEAVDSMQNA